MSDGRAFDDQGLPWLEAVDDEDGPTGMSARKMVAALLMVLLAGAIIAGTFFWLGRRDAPVDGAPELIRAAHCALTSSQRRSFSASESAPRSTPRSAARASTCR